MPGSATRPARIATAGTATAAAAAVELIREAIIDGRLAPNQRLKEEHLALEFGISRTPVREALRLLRSEGLVEAEPNRGSTVRGYAADDIREMYELRMVLECLAARRAALRMTAAQLAMLHASCAAFAALVEGAPTRARAKGLVEENAVFHDVILDAAESERLAAMVRQVIARPLVYQSYLSYSTEQAELALTAHEQLTAAFATNDEQRAEALMRIHVIQARDALLARIAGDEA